MCSRLCEGFWAWHRELAPSLPISLFLYLSISLSLSLSLSLRRDRRSLTPQNIHTGPEHFDTNLPPEFQYIDSSRSSDCPLPKPLAAARKYMETLYISFQGWSVIPRMSL